MQAGEKLGHYEITGLIGHGGMGEVYKARDPRLNRDVAIKSSRDQFTERFEREAGAIAALNHPNICTLYDVGPNYLVMEFVQGQTLDERIKEGTVPLEEALKIAHQITDALEAAHERGVTHRDLKPGNIMIRTDGTVKVLDFGLAKVGSASTPADSAITVSLAATQAGTILGTPAYMSPEQAKGRSNVDKRADIWAFGAVLFEMLTGERAFPGDDVTEVLAAVVLKEPALDKAPPHLRRLLKKCLEKDPNKRLRDIGDVWDYMDGPDAAQTGSARDRRDLMWPANIPMPERVSSGATLRMSPDGRYVAFRGVGDGGSRLWLHDLRTNQSRPMTGTEGVLNAPFWSPDSRTIAFSTQDRLSRASVSGGPPVKIADISAPANVSFWTPDNRIVFGTTLSGVFVVPSGGGALKPLTELAPGEIQHAPQGLLPDGSHFLYLIRGTGQTAGVNLRAIDDDPRTPGRRVLSDDSSALFAAARNGANPGWIMFVRDSTLLAQPFDPARMEVAGEPVAVSQLSGNLGGFSVSDTGHLVYGNLAQGSRQLDWYDREGTRIESLLKGRALNEIELSPDGTRVAAVDNPDRASIWVYEFARKSETQITQVTRSPAVRPVWSPNGQRLIWVGIETGGFQFKIRAASTADTEQSFAAQITKAATYPSSWSRDGRFVLYETSLGNGTGRDRWCCRSKGTSQGCLDRI